MSVDKLFGDANEIKVVKYLNTVDSCNYEFFKNDFDTMDFCDDDEVCELKSRRVPHDRYPDTMIGLNKIIRAMKDEVNEYKFFFLFTDGLYVWNFNRDDFSIRQGGRRDRGKNEIKDYAFIPYECLDYVTNIITSNSD
jgi:hypothetical protein